MNMEKKKIPNTKKEVLELCKKAGFVKGVKAKHLKTNYKFIITDLVFDAEQNAVFDRVDVMHLIWLNGKICCKIVEDKNAKVKKAKTKNNTKAKLIKESSKSEQDRLIEEAKERGFVSGVEIKTQDGTEYTLSNNWYINESNGCLYNKQKMDLELMIYNKTKDYWWDSSLIIKKPEVIEKAGKKVVVVEGRCIACCFNGYYDFNSDCNTDSEFCGLDEHHCYQLAENQPLLIKVAQNKPSEIKNTYKYKVKIDDTTPFGGSSKESKVWRVFIDELTHIEALSLREDFELCLLNKKDITPSRIKAAQKDLDLLSKQLEQIKELTEQRNNAERENILLKTELNSCKNYNTALEGVNNWGDFVINNKDTEINNLKLANNTLHSKDILFNSICRDKSIEIETLYNKVDKLETELKAANKDLEITTGALNSCESANKFLQEQLEESKEAIRKIVNIF